jgi:hypothetical protein
MTMGGGPNDRSRKTAQYPIAASQLVLKEANHLLVVFSKGKPLLTISLKPQ